MRVLFDQGTPVPLRRLLPHHEVATAYEQDWSTMKNGELLAVAELAGFQVLVTTMASFQRALSISHPGLRRRAQC